MSGSMPPRYVTVEEECRRNPQLKISDLQILKDWMDKQPHLPKTEMFHLIMFLHRNNYQIEPTKKMIENFFTARTHTPELFSNRNPITWEPLRKTLISMGKVVLEQETRDACFIIYAKAFDSDPNKYDFFEWGKYLLMIGEMHNIIRGTNNGYTIIVDARVFSFGHLARTNLIGVKKMLFYIHEAAPMRLKAIHLLNVNPAIQALLNLMKPFMNAEMWNVMYTHTDLETLKEFMPVENLPNESGGKAGPLKELVAKHIELLSEFRDWFEYDERNNRVDESLRIGKCETKENLFGADGSFRKLDID